MTGRRRIIAWAAAGIALLVACAQPIRPTATALPTPGPAPEGAKPILLTRGPTPTAMPGSRPPTSTKVTMREQYWLLELPRDDAQRLPIGLIGTGREWDAKEMVGGWVRIDAGPFTGWAPTSVVTFN